ETHAPVKPPVTMRAVSPGGAVRLGVFGSLSKMISVTANTLRIITAGSEPTRDSRRVSVSHPRYTAHATAAAGVSERNPAKNPIRNANNRVIYGPRGIKHIFIKRRIYFDLTKSTRQSLLVIRVCL